MSRISLITLGAVALLLAGCGSLGGPKVDVTVFAPATPVQTDPAWPQADWTLSVGVQAANPLLDSPRIAVRPSANQVQTYKGARWANNPPDLLETALMQGFEDSGRIASVSRLGGSGRGDLGLIIEVRAFETVYRDGGPEAVVEVQARLLQIRAGQVVSKRFRQTVPGAGADIESMVDAFGRAMSALSTDVVGWTLVEGNRLRQASVQQPAKK